MKRNGLTISAIAASLVLGTAVAAYAQSSGSMGSDSSGSMNSGSMKSDTMKSGTMKSGDSMSGGMMKKSVMVGGAPMYANKTIVENASKAKNLTTLVKAVKAAGLVDTLSGKGPFTVFAPTNKAFAKVPKSTLSDLMKPSMKKELTQVLTYHVVPGKLTAADLKAMIKKDGGSANLTTVEGEPLTVKMSKGHLVLIDKKGGGAVIDKANVMQSNGVVHVIDSVLMP